MSEPVYIETRISRAYETCDDTIDVEHIDDPLKDGTYEPHDPVSYIKVWEGKVYVIRGIWDGNKTTYVWKQV